MEKNDRVKNKMGKKSIVKIIERGGMETWGEGEVERKSGERGKESLMSTNVHHLILKFLA